MGCSAVTGVAVAGLGVLLLTAGRYGLGALALVAFVSVAIATGRDIARFRVTNGAGAADA
ncbi:hypothetical protein ACWD5F_12670 [Streptomyces sp. NPDC002499]